MKTNSITWQELKKFDPCFLRDSYINNLDKVYGTKEDYEDLLCEFVIVCAIIDKFKQTPKCLTRKIPAFWRDYHYYKRIARRLARIIKIFVIIN